MKADGKENLIFF